MSSLMHRDPPTDKRELKAIRKAEKARKARGIGFAPPGRQDIHQ